MKSLMWRLCSITALAALALFFRPVAASAQDGNERLDRLERRVNELAERQEQFMRRMGAQMEHQAPVAQPGHENVRPPLAPPVAPGPQNPHAAKAAKGLHGLFGLFFLIGCICNILLAIWIYTDIRKRNEGSGIFVAMAIFAGIPAALIYALTRLGDKKT